MLSDALSIGELADAANLSRRAVRFYVQQKLIPPPAGVGRGRHYGAEHLERLRKIAELQSAGHSLEAIRRILGGASVATPPTPIPMRRAKAPMTAELWTRLRIADGVELHFDATRHQPDVAKLIALREAIRGMFAEREIADPDAKPDVRVL